ncbi:MAG TPA: hypothetical protein VGE72_00450 [Azospirillum sp.]
MGPPDAATRRERFMAMLAAAEAESEREGFVTIDELTQEIEAIIAAAEAAPTTGAQSPIGANMRVFGALTDATINHSFNSSSRRRRGSTFFTTSIRRKHGSPPARG